VHGLRALTPGKNQPARPGDSHSCRSFRLLVTHAIPNRFKDVCATTGAPGEWMAGAPPLCTRPICAAASDSMLEGKTVSIHDQHPSVPFHVKRGEGGHQVTKRTC
jgi:hypothetical protein